MLTLPAFAASVPTASRIPIVAKRWLASPYPYFGGKRTIAREVWKRLGDTANYVEPFFGSGAMLLARPLDHLNKPRTETVNDLNGYIANFWRAVRADPQQVAHYADWPVNENDLHARHYWLVCRKDELRQKLEGDPEYCDAKIAGWWVWGMAAWIGSGFCDGNGLWAVEDGKLVKGDAGQGIQRQLIHAGDAGQGIQRQLGDRGAAIAEWFTTLQARLAQVRVASGDWTRVCGDSVTTKLGVTGVFLDPPYHHDEREVVYEHDDNDVAEDVRQWCLAHGDNPLLRIAYCGYTSEARTAENFLPGWTPVAWKAKKGFGGQRKDGTTNDNRQREMIWYSPHCLKVEAKMATLPLFAAAGD